MEEDMLNSLLVIRVYRWKVLTKYNDYCLRIEKQIKPNSNPLAIKMITAEDEIPEAANMVRPVPNSSRTCGAPSP
jgi:uncharacterized protein (DUF169 family)